jgi:quercetin dioxygenase-like cupin family protein
MLKIILVSVFAAAALGICCAQNVAQSRPESYKVEIDNQQVRVVRAYHAPHEKVPMHSHPTSVVVYLNDVHELSTTPDGKRTEVRHHAGEVVWSPAHRHALENLSDEPIRVIEIELKPAPAKVSDAPKADR